MHAISESNPLYIRRRRMNKLLMVVSASMLAYGLVWLAWILLTLLIEREKVGHVFEIDVRELEVGVGKLFLFLFELALQSAETLRRGALSVFAVGKIALQILDPGIGLRQRAFRHAKR